MTELEKIALAKSYIDALAQGINPIDKSLIPADDVTNNVRVTRCLFYVSDILSQVIENGGTATRIKRYETVPFGLSDEARKSLVPESGRVTVRDMTAKINSFIDESTTKKLKNTTIGAWLLSIGMLENVTDSTGKSTKRPTDAGREAGIYTIDKISQYGVPYKTVCYNEEAQQFVFDNIEALAHQNRLKAVSKAPHALWSAVQDELLRDLYKNGAAVEEIAESLSRTQKDVVARLEEMGL